MTLYHAIEILLVAAIVGACSASVARHFGPSLREWLYPTPPSEKTGGASCGSGGCNGCSPSKTSNQH